MAGKYPEVQHAYDQGGLGGGWKWAKVKGLTRWIKARNWAHKRVKQSQDPARFKKAEIEYTKKVNQLQHHHERHQTGGPYPGNDPRNDNFELFDGRWVPKWMAAVNKRARAFGV